MVSGLLAALLGRRVLLQVLEGAGDRRRHFGSYWQNVAVGLVAVLVGRVRDHDGGAVGCGVLEGALDRLGAVVHVHFLQLAMLLHFDAVARLVTVKRQVVWLSGEVIRRDFLVMAENLSVFQCHTMHNVPIVQTFETWVFEVSSFTYGTTIA